MEVLFCLNPVMVLFTIVDGKHCHYFPTCYAVPLLRRHAKLLVAAGLDFTCTVFIHLVSYFLPADRKSVV